VQRPDLLLGLARGVLDAGADPPELVGLVVGGERPPELGVAPVLLLLLLGVGPPGGRVEGEVLRERRGGRGGRRVGGVPRPRALAEAPRHGRVGGLGLAGVPLVG